MQSFCFFGSYPQELPSVAKISGVLPYGHASQGAKPHKYSKFKKSVFLFYSLTVFLINPRRTAVTAEPITIASKYIIGLFTIGKTNIPP